jgi:hypothetical protein
MPPKKVARPVPKHQSHFCYQISLTLLLVLCVAYASKGTAGVPADCLPVLAPLTRLDLAPTIARAAAIVPAQPHPDLSLSTAFRGELPVYERFYTELLVTVLKDDMQVRWATPQERTQVLQSIFAASGW